MSLNQMCRAQRTCDNGAEDTAVNSLPRVGNPASRPGAAARVAAGLGLAATLLLTGCHNFFLCQKASCPSSGTGTGGTGSTSGELVYVSNSSSGPTYISAYDISKGSLKAISGSPYNLGYQPVAMNVSPNDAFLYVATLPGAANPGIYLYAINSSGQLSSANGGNVLISTTVGSMDISSDGKFLFALSSSGALLTEYKADPVTGDLALLSNFPVSGLTCALAGAVASQTCTVKVAPSKEFVAVSLGTSGTVIFPYTSTSGIISGNYTTIPSGSTTASPTGDYSVALDSTNRVFIARTNALAVWQINDTAGDANQLSSTSYNSGVTPRSVVLSNSGSFVYTANEGNGTISAWSMGTTGGLTAVAGSPFTGPSSVSALGVDKSGSYMVAAGYNSSSGVQLFSIGSTGALTLAASAGSGTSTAYPVVLAMSH